MHFIWGAIVLHIYFALFELDKYGTLSNFQRSEALNIEQFKQMKDNIHYLDINLPKNSGDTFKMNRTFPPGTEASSPGLADAILLKQT